MEVGQKVLVRTLDRPYTKGELAPASIVSVGKKYFTVDIIRDRFFKDTLYSDNGKYAPQHRVYLSDQDFEEEVEAGVLDCFRDRLRGIFSGPGHYSISKETIKTIIKLIENDLQANTSDKNSN